MKRTFSSILISIISVATSLAQVSWDRQAYGQGPFYAPGHQGDPLYSYFYPNNNSWSQELTFAYDNNGKPIYVAAPSNWSTDTYPRSGDVTLGNGGLGTNNTPTNLDRGAHSGTTGGAIVLNSLTIQQDGALNMEAGTTLTANLFNFQGNNNNDAVLTNNGGGGAFPILFLSGGGTMKKTTGTSTFSFDQFVSIQVNGGGTIAADAGALQLPLSSRYAGGVSFNAATGALIDLATAGAVDSAVVRFTGAMTGINTGGTVRLNKGWISTVANTGGSTLNFGGNTFQWQGGRLNGTAADPFTNLGTINITGSATLNGVDGFINKNAVIQSGLGTLDLYRGSLNNAAGAVYEIRNDMPITDYGPFINAGTLRRSTSAGTVTLDPNLQIINNGGTIQVDTGTLLLPAANSHYSGGTFNVAAGGLLDLADAGAVDSGAIHFSGTFTGANIGGTVRLSHGWWNTAADTGGPATFNFAGNTFQWTGGRIGAYQPNQFTNTGTINITGSVVAVGDGLVNAGSIIQSGLGSLDLRPYPGSYTNAVGSVYDLQNDLGITSNSGAFNNAGTWRKSAGSGTSVINVGDEFNNSGVVELQMGTTQFSHLHQTAGITNLNGGNLSSNTDIVLDGGSVIGTGVISGNIRNNGGAIAPGHSPGKITINGSYAQGANGSLNIEIGGNAPGTGYDQLVVNGAAALGGTLNITTINGYRPAVGDVFTIISPQSFTGSFAQINATGLSVQANYAAGAITVTVTSVPDLLLNISTRLKVLTDDKALIGGFIITGTEPKKVIIRGIGPSLTGVPGALQDPTLELFDDKTSLATNDNWKQDQQAEIQASGVAPTKDAEAAIVRTLNPGNYTAVVRGKNNSVGIGVVEVYDLAQTAKAKLANISSRGFVDTGDNALIGGFIAGGSGGGTNTKVVIRAIGPSLADAGVAGSLADPTLELKDANGSTVRGNDNWKDSQQAELEAIGIQPKKDAESALIATLPAGNYTAIVRGKGDTTGVGLVEVYN
ncbi:MAG: hypothetical protein M3Y69_03315, partial [Verrucomicrobiota bacterium]|nr:hypothetical protein [Verrucomicrobiota bacterium]